MTLKKQAKWLIHSHCPGFKGWFKYHGFKVFFPKDAWIFRLACEQGIYESELLRLIQGLASQDSWYFDVGANIGLMSVPLLRTRADLKVLSFEPSPNTSSFLLKTWEESGLKDRWKVRAAAAGKTKGSIDFSYGPASLGGYDGLRHTKRVAQLGTKTVEMVTLDDEWDNLGRPKVSFIKLDIEGAELLALEGAQKLIQENKPFILVEWYAENLIPYDCRAEDLLDFAARHSYDVVAVPTMSVARNSAMLRALMVGTSAFLLIPTGVVPMINSVESPA